MASAQTFDAWSTADARDRRPQESPQNAALELRVGPYVPKIGDGLSWNGDTFDSAFSDKKRAALAIEVDWQVLRMPYVGSLGPGFSIGFTKMKTFLDKDQFEPENQDQAVQEVSLTIMPTYLVAVLRIDGLARHTPVPLVPYGKVGVGYARWSVKQWEGTPPEATWSAGFQGALGIMLQLDPFDRGADILMDTNFGVNSSYFFLEWYDSELDGFGSGNDLNVGTNTWFLGLALEI